MSSPGLGVGTSPFAGCSFMAGFPFIGGVRWDLFGIQTAIAFVQQNQINVNVGWHME